MADRLASSPVHSASAPTVSVAAAAAATDAATAADFHRAVPAAVSVRAISSSRSHFSPVKAAAADAGSAALSRSSLGAPAGSPEGLRYEL